MTVQETKLELIGKFSKEKTYLGAHIRKEISDTNFKEVKSPAILTGQVKKGDVFVNRNLSKPRPAVVISVDNKNKICKIVPLTTSAECIHNTGISHNSRFISEGYYSYSMDVVSTDYVCDNFICVIEDSKKLNEAIKLVRQFFSE